MPKNPSTAAPKKTKSTNKTPAKSPRTADPNTPAGLTPNQAAVLQRLCEQSGMSTAEVAAAESIGHSTAQKALTVLEAAGLARREAGVRNGALKSPDRWFTATTASATSTDLESTRDAPPGPTDTDDATAADVAGEDDGDPGAQRDAVEPADFTAATPSTVPSDQGPDPIEGFATVNADTTSQGEPQESAAGLAQPDMAEPEGPASAPDGDSATEPGSSDVQSTQPAPAEEVAQEQVAPAKNAQPEEAAVVEAAGSDDADPTEQEQLAPPAAAPGLSPDPGQTVEPEAPAAAKGKPKPRPKKEPKEAAPAAVTPKPDSAAAPATARLAHGELQQMVADHLRAHPERAWTPSATAKALGGRSAGAVANACEKLLDTMDGLKTFDDAPRRYQYTPPAPPKTKKTK